MLFNSLTFALFFVVFMAIYWATLRTHRLQTLLVLVASYIFYGWWDWRFLLLITFTIVVDFVIGRRLGAAEDGKRRNRLLWLSIGSNLLVLGFFKYFNFFVDSAERLANSFDWNVNTTALNIILPVGISFYTFQSMSYVIDIYRRDIKPTDSVVNYAAYVSFFPQLVAGPIERASRLLPQIIEARKIGYHQISEGMHLICWGLFKKIFIADNLAKIVNPVFAMNNPSSEQVLLATYAFAFQIYCDFSAYSDIARGIAKMMGVELMLNFRLPYVATNPADFWRRWHISLSTWLRDYLYKPLGGSRKGSLFTYRNLFVTMVLGGLWHGAHMNFVIWGIYQGALLVIYRLLGINPEPPSSEPGKFSLSFDKSRLFPVAKKLLAWFIFFHLMCYGWLIFRATSEAQIFSMTGTLLNGIDIKTFLLSTPKFGFFILPLLLVQFLQLKTSNMSAILGLNVATKTVIYVAMFYLAIVFGALESSEFIYFQF